MIKKKIKGIIRNNTIIESLLVYTIYLYLRITYFTSKWEFVWPQDLNQNKINQLNGVLFALWHNRLAFGMYIFQNINNVYALASPHADGKIITKIIKKMNFSVISGSTNRNPTRALKQIISKINLGNNIVVTPDGPRGPVYRINSSVTRLAKRLNKPLIPVSCTADKYYQLKSWDKMIIPKFFAKITVRFGKPIKFKDDDRLNDLLLADTLTQLS